MKVTSQTLQDRQVELAIEVEDERVQKALQHAARHIANTAHIPGFRKGKAPYNVVLRTFGQDALFQEMLEELGPQVYREALEESQLDPYDIGQLQDVTKDPLVLKFIVPLRPEIDLGDYHTLRVPFTTPEVKEEAVDEVLQSLQERNAIMEPAGEGPVEWNHIATLTLTAKLDPDSEATLFHEHDVPLLVAETTDYPFPGFVANLLGMKVGEEKTVTLTVPDDYDDAEMRGKTIYIQTELDDLKVRHVPPLDDALAQTIGDYETMEALRQAARQRLEEQALHEANGRYGNTCAQKLAEQARVEFPPQIVQVELDSIVERAKSRLKEQKLSWEEFLNIKKQTEEQYREEMRPQAANNVRRALALGKLAELEQIDVSDREIDQVIHNVIERYNDQADEIRQAVSSDDFRRSVHMDLFSGKIMARLVGLCKGQEPTPEQAAALPPETLVADDAPATEGQ